MFTIRQKVITLSVAVAFTAAQTFSAFAAAPTGPAREAAQGGPAVQEVRAEAAVDAVTFGPLSNIPDGFSQIPGTPICCEDTLGQGAGNRALQAFNKLPDTVKRLLRHTRTPIYIGSREDVERAVPLLKHNAPMTAGYTAWKGTKRDGSLRWNYRMAVGVYTSAPDCELRVTDIEPVMLHEIGHVIDFYFSLERGGALSAKAEFAPIRQLLADDRARGEVFADGFMYYIRTMHTASNVPEEVFAYYEAVLEDIHV